MSLRIPSERTSEAVFILQTVRNILAMFIVAAIIATFISADPDHIHTLALTSALRDWLYAVFNL